MSIKYNVMSKVYDEVNNLQFEDLPFTLGWGFSLYLFSSKPVLSWWPRWRWEM